ncbi:DUF397 domain-containing protein [Streptomyces sp. NPDC046805]
MEVADGIPGGVVPVRDSKAPDGPVMTVAAASWAVFVSELKGIHGRI